LSGDRVDPGVAHAAASDSKLPVQVRLAAWAKSGRKLDLAVEGLIVDAMQADGFHLNAAAAQALSAPTVGPSDVVRLLHSEAIDAAKAARIIDNVFNDWRESKLLGRIRALLEVAELRGSLRDIALLYSIEGGDQTAIDRLLDRMGELSTGLVGATVMLLGHVPEKKIVERIVAAISARTWSAEDRASLAGAFATGLTYRMKMFALRSGILETIPFHPGRDVPHGLLKSWLACNDYSALDRLRIVLDGVRLGMPEARVGLRSALDAALATGAADESNASAIAGQAIELLHAHGDGLAVEELEQLARNSSYNLASSAVALISARGTPADARTLAGIYPEADAGLRLLILSHLEPLASRLALRVSKNGSQLQVNPA
jgi:hypothetical protein